LFFVQVCGSAVLAAEPAVARATVPKIRRAAARSPIRHTLDHLTLVTVHLHAAFREDVNDSERRSCDRNPPAFDAR